MVDLEHVFDRKFLLASVTIITGAAMVFTGKLEGQSWALMAGTIVSGFFAVLGWTKEEVKE